MMEENVRIFQVAARILSSLPRFSHKGKYDDMLLGKCVYFLEYALNMKFLEPYDRHSDEERGRLVSLSQCDER